MDCAKRAYRGEIARMCWTERVLDSASGFGRRNFGVCPFHRAGGTLKEMPELLTSDAFPLETGADGVVRVRGTRITLDTMWSAFNEGATAEEIVQQYPSLSLADAYQAIGYCLRHPALVAGYLAKRNDFTEETRKSNESRWRPEGIRTRLLQRRQR